MRALMIGLCAVPLLVAGAEAAPRRAAAPKPAAAALPAPVHQPGETPGWFDVAPWWMDRPVLPQTGFAETEVEANRAIFAARFKGTGKTASEAQQQAVSQTAELIAALRKRPVDAVRIATDFTVQAFYEQYRDKDGEKIDNVRGDKIRGYDATLTLRIEARDMATLEPVYALVLAAAPTQVDRVVFSLRPDNALRDRLRIEAVRDAGVRAQGAAEATGSRLGGIRLIDSSSRACRADILGRDKDNKGDDDQVTHTSLERKRAMADSAEVRVTGSRAAVLEARAAENAFIQTPPLYRIRVQTCVVYDLK
ncbi:SIMPL domain-containing protein [Asticcacaulis sp. AND118]|uniref:SIMPL domain-containing protein n=1 Tax=Asticcacaulis sp. AND118 TaxID=2840468 RepID=UPI001CFF9C8B|nr:SIMPL domain-containing protein [Asticcacaulis sp. AND118]UDF03073.1 SIMPL domain-containing protein [Asticcacaulis sp. AND118]